MKVTLCSGLPLALAVTCCLCRPAAPGTAGDPHQHPNSLARRDWPGYLSQEQQHLLSQFLPHVLTELNNHKDYVQGVEGVEALHDYYYPDWMDFGRRSAEDAANAV
ncbi:PREDICTED: gastrin/cholecystokinin-like peptide [Acanthisitta chloris]|uniref:gastrin/cholecystokinin-like peptide n=1 Tax=Acanthisitta chloris TaxID=57068 RepID=UPI0004F0C59D|nr:PREDICTED: gastrin/cholecystokinin-like peptide [Acanthisitta chloris]